jgi:hypothetical protein
VLDVLDRASSQVPAETKARARERLNKTLKPLAVLPWTQLAVHLGTSIFLFRALVLPLATLVWLALSARSGQYNAQQAKQQVPLFSRIIRGLYLPSILT